MRLVQRLLGVLDTPGAHGVAAPRGDRAEIHTADARALDEIGLAVAHEGEAAVDGHHFNGHSAMGTGRCDQAGK